MGFRVEGFRVYGGFGLWSFRARGSGFGLKGFGL